MGARNYLFRTVVLGTLLIVAAIFAVSGNEQISRPHTDNKPASKADNIRPDESLWIRTLNDAPSFWTAVLAGLTFVLAGVGVGQIIYLRRADETARVSATAALKAAQAAERSAIVAENALVGAEAPFIFATAETWKEGDPLAPGDRPGFASVTLHNYGRSPAIVREFYPGTIRCVGLPDPIAYPLISSASHKDQVIPANGHGEPWRFAKGAFLEFSADQAETDPHATYWIVGLVRYADTFGTQYVTGFCFALNAFSGQFYGMGGSAYNYRRRLTEGETREAEASDAELPYRRPTERSRS